LLNAIFNSRYPFGIKGILVLNRTIRILEGIGK